MQKDFIMKIKIITAILLFILSGILLVAFSSNISKSIVNSVNVCLTVIVPSLYGFLILSDFFISSNLYYYASKPFKILSRYIFKIPPEYFSVFLISQLGGFPVGAKLLSDLRKSNKIDEDNASYLICCCYSSGPAFLIGAVGTKLYSSVKMGLLLFLSALTVNIIIAVIMGLFRDIPAVKKESEYKIELSFDKIIKSVNSGAKALFQICSMIVFFSIIISILNSSGIISFLSEKFAELAALDKSTANTIINTIFEISNISLIATGEYSLLPILSSLISFGGLCVIIQIISIAGKYYSVKRFLIIRTLSVILSYYIMKMFINIFSINLMVFANTSQNLQIYQISPIPSIFLLIMTILLLSKKNVAKF